MIHITADAACSILFCRDIALVDTVCHQALRDEPSANRILDRACCAVLRVLVVDRHRTCDAAYVDITLHNALVDAGVRAPGRDRVDVLIIDLLIELLDAQTLNVYHTVCQQIKHDIQLIVHCPKVIVNEI